MRRIPARIRFAPRTGLRKSAVAPRRCMWRRHFYNRSSAVVAHASVSRGRRANPVLTYETALRRFSLCATSFYNRSSAVVAHASVSRGRRANPVLTYETALRRFPLCATSFYNRTSAVFVMHRAVGACRWMAVFCDAPHVGACRWRMVFCDALRRWRIPKGNGFFNGGCRWLAGGFYAELFLWGLF